jgi:hypothetical protein
VKKIKSPKPRYPNLLEGTMLDEAEAIIEKKIERLHSLPELVEPEEPQAHEVTLVNGRLDLVLPGHVRDPEDAKEDEAFLLHDALMLRTFVHDVRRGEAPSELVLQRLCYVFEQVLSGEPWDAVVALPGREPPVEWGGHSEKEHKHRQLAIAIDFFIRLNGTTVESAIAAVASGCHVSEGTARKAYYDYKQILAAEDSEFDQRFNDD